MDKIIRDKYALNAESINQAVEEVSELLSHVSIDSKDVLRLKLSLEEVLLKYQEAFSEDAVFSLRLSNFLGSFRVSLKVHGKSFDPLANNKKDTSILGSLMAHSETLEMAWSYHLGANLVTFTISRKQKLGFGLHILLGIALGTAAGFLIRSVAPYAAENIATRIIVPVTNSFTGLLCVMATIMCFGAVTLGIVRMGDISTFSTVGKRMLRSFLLVSLVLTLLNTAWLVPGMRFGMSTEISLNLYDFWYLMLAFVPNNILSPILEFNSVHIIIIACMFGVAMLKMGKNSTRLTEVFDQVNTVAIMSNGYLNRFIPTYVGLMICAQILKDESELVYSFAQLIVIVLIGEVITLIIYTIVVCVRLRVNAFLFIRKLSSAFLISLTTASVGAAFFTTIDTLIGQLGVDDNLAPLAYNMGGILFRPGYCIVFTACSLFTAYYVGIQVTWTWVFAAFLLSFILSVATPPVIGGTTVCFSILFSQLGIGTESLAVIISINAVLEFLTVAVNNYCLQCQITLLAKSFNKLNLETLRS